RGLDAPPPSGLRGTVGSRTRRGDPPNTARDRLPMDPQRDRTGPLPDRPRAGAFAVEAARLRRHRLRRGPRPRPAPAHPHPLRLPGLCVFESGTATLSADVRTVRDARSGSAPAARATLRGVPTTAALGPLLVSGRTVAGAPEGPEELRETVAAAAEALASRLN